ncbi:MAG: hypothetical protein ACPGD8_01115 [Flavobacteriales bacterium]
MKKQAMNNGQQTATKATGKDTLSRVLLIGAIILYSASLVLLANLALAEGATSYGALVKVNNNLDGTAFAEVNPTIKSVHGNVLSIDIANTNYVKLNDVVGVCASQLDFTVSSTKAELNAKNAKAKYAGADVVIGILDNSGILSGADISSLKKVEYNANVGFISYQSEDPNSTVIMRNIVGGESNLVQALAYMQEYANTVEKPLIVELALSGEELNNPLFVQVCQKIADAGVQFLGADLGTGYVKADAPVQMAFSMFNAETGQLTDVSDFWAINEVKEQEIMLLGSDEQTCKFHFQTEAGFEKVYMSNSSADLVMVTAITASGEVSYYHVQNKETALIPRELMNGTAVLEDGMNGVYPYYTKMALFNDAPAKNQFVALNNTVEEVELAQTSEMALSVGSPMSRTLAMTLDNLEPNMKIEIKNATGETVYRNQPDEETTSIQTKIDLSDGAEGLYFLDLTSPLFHQTFALLMD